MGFEFHCASTPLTVNFDFASRWSVMFKLGERLRAMYPTAMVEYARSTDRTRTMQSMAAVLTGLGSSATVSVR